MVNPGLTPLEVVYKDYRDASKKARIQFSEELDPTIDLSSSLSIRLLKADNTTEIAFKIEKIEIESKNFIVIELTPEVEEVEDGILEIEFSNKKEIRSKENQLVFLQTDSVEISPISYYNPSGQQESVETVASATETTLKIVMYLSFIVSISTAFTLLKILQMTDFLTLLNIQHPRNLQTFLNMASSSVLNDIPNFLEFLTNEKCSIQKHRLIEEEVSCQIFNNVGNYFVLMTIFLATALILRFLRWIFSNKNNCFTRLLDSGVARFGVVFWVDAVEAIQLDIFLNLFITFTEFEFNDPIQSFNYLFSLGIGIFTVVLYIGLLFVKKGKSGGNEPIELNKGKTKILLALGVENQVSFSKKVIENQPNSAENQKELKNLEDDLGKQNDLNTPQKHKFESLFFDEDQIDEPNPEKMKKLKNDIQPQKNTKPLENEGQSRFQDLFEDFKPDRFYQRNYRSFCGLRDLIISFSVVILHDYPDPQVGTLLLTMLMFTGLEFYYHPKIEKKENFMEKSKAIIYSVILLLFAMILIGSSGSMT